MMWTQNLNFTRQFPSVIVLAVNIHRISYHLGDGSLEMTVGDYFDNVNWIEKTHLLGITLLHGWDLELYNYILYSGEK